MVPWGETDASADAWVAALRNPVRPPEYNSTQRPRPLELIALISMAQLIVRNLDEDLVRRLKRRAAAHGRSMEEEHRLLLRQVLQPEGLGEALLSMPNVGVDADFSRLSDLPRDLDLR